MSIKYKWDLANIMDYAKEEAWEGGWEGGKAEGIEIGEIKTAQKIREELGA